MNEKLSKMITQSNNFWKLKIFDGELSEGSN
jgi:hypothetical protein